jgi:hypothetical protein
VVEHQQVIEVLNLVLCGKDRHVWDVTFLHIDTEKPHVVIKLHLLAHACFMLYPQVPFVKAVLKLNNFRMQIFILPYDRRHLDEGDHLSIRALTWHSLTTTLQS